MDDNQNKNSHDDEIDLRKLFEAVGNFFAKIWFWFIGILIWFKGITLKSRYFLLVGVLVGFGWAFYNTQAETPYYQGSLLLSSKYLRPEVIQNIVDDLNQSDAEELAAVLKLDTAITSQIGRISFKPVLDEDSKMEIEKLKETLITAKLDPAMQAILTKSLNEQLQSYEITINTYKSEILNQVVESLGNFSFQYPYIKDRSEIDQAIAEKKRVKLIQESIKLDSLKNMIFKNLEARNKDTREGSNNVILAEGESANPLNVFDQEIKFFDQIQAIDRTLALNENFQFFKGSNQRTTPASPSFIDNAITGTGYSLAVVYIILFLIQINQYLNRVEKMQKEEQE